ncbi:hypothetical protein FOL46_005049 [Perkinsus olseni]|uniref:Uncharacterized protein n=1 Tax=Perkinsus olseni TaxID=32597 RepID=A0A7J6LUP0_PEROL|nr:hypothetical protein FOL46_005049 [Perkinsus olseni]
MGHGTVEELLREQLETIRKRLELSEEEREAAEQRATNLEGTLVQERDKSAATIEQLRQLVFQKDDDSGTPPRDRLLSPSTQHSEDKSSGDQVLLERNSVSLQHYQAEKLEHSRRSEAALLVLQSKDETIAKLREEKEAVAAEKSQWEEEKRKMTEQNAAMQTRFDSLLTESARLHAEVNRLQELNDAAATEFEVLRSAETSARKQVGALHSSVLNHQREVADLRAELARMKRSTAEAGVQTAALRPLREELLEENSALKREVERLAEDLGSREKQQQQTNTESAPPADQQALRNLRGQLAELSIEIQRCKFAEKEAIRQRDVAVADLEAEMSRQAVLNSSGRRLTCEELEVTWPVKEFLRGVDRVENSKMVAELRKEVHTAEQARYDLLVRSQAELKSLTARAHSAEEEARRVHILCDDRQAVIGRLQGECAELEEGRRAQREERERLSEKLHQVFDEWSAAQEKWDAERVSLQSKLVGLESELERRQAEVEEVRESLAALAKQGGASDGDELTLSKRVHQLTARVLSLSRLEYDARARAERMSIAHDASERRATRLEEAIGRVRAQLRHSEQQRGTLELKISEKGVLEKETEPDGCLSADAMEEANAKLRAHIDEMTRLHKCQVERMLSQVGSFERALEAISQALPEFTPPTGLGEVLSGMPGKPDVGELLLATAERLWKEEAKAQRLQTLLERWWRNWRCSEEALMALVAKGPSGVVSKEGTRWKGMRDTNRLLRESLGRALEGWYQCRVELAALSRSMQSDKTPRKDEEERASTERPISPGVAVDDGSAEAVYKKALEGITTRLLDYSKRIDSLRSENNMLKERLGAERKLDDPEAERIFNEEDPRLRQLLEKFSSIEMTLSSMAVELDKENVTAPPVVASQPSSVSLEVMAAGDDIEEVIAARVEVECRKMRVLHKGELARARIDLERELTELKEKLEAERAVSMATIEGHAAEASRLKLQLDQLRKRLAVCMEAVSVDGSESDALVALQRVCGELARFERGEADLSQKDDGPAAAASPSKTDKRKLKRILAAQRQVILLLQGSSPSTPNEGVAVERALLRVLNRIQQSVESTISSTTKKGRSPNSISSADLRLLLTACEAMARDISKKTTAEHHRCVNGEQHQQEEPKEAEAARDKEIERLVESRVQEHVHRYDAVLRRVEVMAEQQRLMHRKYKDVTDRLAETKAQLTTKSIVTEKLSKLKSEASQTIELPISDGGVQTENTALWTAEHRCAGGEEQEEPKEAEAARDKEIERLVESRVQEHVHRYDAVLRRVEVMAEQQRLMHRKYKDVTGRLAEVKAQLTTKSIDTEKLSKLESVASQTIELLTSDGGVQTENTALWTVGCQTATDTMAKGTQVEVPSLEARVGVARWTSIEGAPPACLQCPELRKEICELRRALDDSHQVLATSERNCCHSQHVIHGLNKKVEELKASLMAAESRLKCRTKGVQTTRRLAVSSSSLSLEERMMTGRLAAVLGKAEKMTANLIRSQSSSPPRSRMVTVTAPPPSRIASKASSGNPVHLETVRTLREEIGNLRNEREQLKRDLAECREEKRGARMETSRRLADANEELRRLNKARNSRAIETERIDKADMMDEMTETVEELRRTKQKANHQDIKIRALREELRVARESVKEKERALLAAEAAGESRKGEADSEVVAKLKCCRRDLKSRDATINDLRKEISATKCHGIEAEAKINDSETRLKNARADAQRQARMAEQMKGKAMEAQEALSRASRAEAEGKERENKLRVELERLKRQLEVTKAKLEQVTAEVDSLREQEARRVQEKAVTYFTAWFAAPSYMRSHSEMGSRQPVQTVRPEASDVSSVLESTSGDISSERLLGSADDDDSDDMRMKVAREFTRLSDDLARNNHGRISSSLFKVCFAPPMQTELVIGVARYPMKVRDSSATATSSISNSPDSPSERGGSETISGRRWAGGDKGHGHSIVSGVPGKKRVATRDPTSGPLKRSRRQPKSRVEPKLTARPPPPGVYHNVFPILNFTKVEMNLTTDLACQLKFWIPGLAAPVSVGPHKIVASLLDDCYEFDHRDNVAIGRTRWAFRKLSDELARRRLPRISMGDIQVRASSSEQVDLVIGVIRYPMRPCEAPAGLVPGSTKAALKAFLQNRRHQSDDGKHLRPPDAGGNHQPLEELMQESEAPYLVDDILNEVVDDEFPWSPSDLSPGFFGFVGDVTSSEADSSGRAEETSGEDMMHQLAGYHTDGN